MYRTTAATGGSHPQHILPLETHIFPPKCHLGGKIKVSQGLAAAPVGSEFHMNSLSFCSSNSHPLGMRHQGLHLPSLAGFGSITSCPLPQQCQGAWVHMGTPHGVPRDVPLTMMGCTGAAARWSLHQLLCRAAAHMKVLEVLPFSRDRVQ